MIENMAEYIKEIRAIVSDRLDLTRDLSDDDIREVISGIIAEKSQEKYLTLTEKKGCYGWRVQLNERT